MTFPQRIFINESPWWYVDRGVWACSNIVKLGSAVCFASLWHAGIATCYYSLKTAHE